MRVPDGWFDYSRFGSPIDSTRIVAIKTPLKKKFNTGKPARLSGDYTKILRGVPVEEEFTPQQMLQQFEERGWDVGLVVDLTFTDRYYDPQDFICRGVKHLKLKCPGHVIPPEDIYQQLRAGILDFLSDPSNGGALVAVHCTHGLNRTGYLTCRYLVEECGYNVERAIRAFNKSRGSDIERENYLEHLRNGCPKTDTQSHSPIRPTCSPDNKQKSNVHSKSQYSVCYDGVSPATPLEHDYCTSSSSSSRHGGGEGGGRRQRKGTGSSGQVWDLRMKLDHKAASREGDSADHRDRGSRRREKRRAHHTEPYQVERHHRHYDHYHSWQPPLPVKYLYHDERQRPLPSYHTPAGTHDHMWTGAHIHTHYSHEYSRSGRDVKRNERQRETGEREPLRW